MSNIDRSTPSVLTIQLNGESLGRSGGAGKFGGRTVTLSDAAQALPQSALGGRAARTTHGRGSGPYLKADWSSTSIAQNFQASPQKPVSALPGKA